MITIYIDFWTYVKSEQRTRNGRKSYGNLWDHFLGAENVNNMVSEAERLLVTTHYSVEIKRIKFERYVKIQKDQHHILEGFK